MMCFAYCYVQCHRCEYDYFYYLQVLVRRSTLKVLEGPKVMMVEKRNFTVRYT